MATQSFSVDPSHSSVGFSVRHMMIAKVHGRFSRWSATLAVDEADFSRSKVNASIEAASIDTNEAKRDEHLKGADFFDAAKFPKIEFTSKRVEGSGERFKVLGDLSLHGVTREVVLEVERQGAGKDPWGNQREAFSARTSINRTDFGLKWNQALETGGILVGEKIDIEMDLSAIKAKA
jgi:polyisoprenoid-binding protein YceI